MYFTIRMNTNILPILIDGRLEYSLMNNTVNNSDSTYISLFQDTFIAVLGRQICALDIKTIYILNNG
jgi:hypothetical protein